MSGALWALESRLEPLELPLRCVLNWWRRTRSVARSEMRGVGGFAFVVLRIGEGGSSPLRGQRCEVWEASASLCLEPVKGGPLHCAVRDARCGRNALCCVYSRWKGVPFVARSEMRGVECFRFFVSRIDEGFPFVARSEMRSVEGPRFVAFK